MLCTVLRKPISQAINWKQMATEKKIDSSSAQRAIALAITGKAGENKTKEKKNKRSRLIRSRIPKWYVIKCARDIPRVRKGGGGH
jgi:hypothetical protein